MGKARDLANVGSVASQGLNFRNKIINGAMVIDQRNSGASVTPTANSYTLDRWEARLSQTSKYSVQQSSVVPSGFRNSLLVTSLSAYTVGSSENFFVKQVIEGLNIADLAWGTANAQPVTLSFVVRSSLTGTFGGSLWNHDGSRSYPFTYTISSANTHETKTITILGDTSGTWLTTNGAGLNVGFGLGVGASLSGTAGAWAGSFFPSATGSTSVVGTNGATFYITGVQLEKGTQATPFEHRPFGTELQLAQRYYSETPNDVGYAIVAQGQWNGSVASAVAIYPQEMRAVPTVTALGTNAGSWYVQQGNTGISTASTTFSGAWGGATTRRGAWLDFANLSGGVSNAALTVMRNIQSTSNRNGCLSFNAEL
jgi:hypothetical protein